MKKSLLFTALFLLAGLAFARTELSEIKKYSVDTLYSKLRAKDADVINAVKNRQVNLNKETVLGYTTLSYAAIDNDVEIVKLLLESGAKPDAGINFPLYEACWAGENIKNRYETISLLLQYGANINKKHRNTTYTPLMATIKKQNGLYAAYLVAHGAKVDILNSEGESALMLAVDYRAGKSDSTVIRKLLEAGANVNFIAKNGNTALSIACFNGDYEIVKLLLDKGAVATTTAKNKNEIPILNACYAGSYESVLELMKHGADINIKDSYGTTALLLSCMSVDNPDLINLCIKNGADVNYVDPVSGHTSFILAAMWNHPKQMEVLFKNGANTKYVNPNIGNTLEYIIANGIIESEPPFFHANELGGAIFGIEKGMLSNNPSVNLRTYTIHYMNLAKTEEKQEDYKKLLDVEIKHSYKGEPQYTIYEAAILNKSEYLAAHKSDLFSKLEEADFDGYTPLQYAKKYRSSDVEKMLIKAGATK